MSIPTAVFLDTSILDAQQYNFQSTALATFVPACVQRGVTLLLPEPTHREITRHIEEWSQQAAQALEDARRKAPMLAKWAGMPKDARAFQGVKSEVHLAAHKEWESFLKRFKVVRLGYESVDLKRVMEWYHRVEAPFQAGRKRKEFPDAFALAMLEAYASKERIHVAVVSSDGDFKLACERFERLLHFDSIPRLTEVLLSDDARLAALQAAVENGADAITEAVYEDLQHVRCYHADNRFQVGDVDWEDMETLDPSVVAIGDRECTVAFYALLKVRAELRFMERTPDGPMDFEQRVRDRVELEGTAKLSFAADGKVSVRTLSFEEYEVKLRETPWGQAW